MPCYEKVAKETIVGNDILIAFSAIDHKVDNILVELSCSIIFVKNCEEAPAIT